MKIHRRPLVYTHSLESRSTDCIKLVVIHCTELPDLATARVWGEKQVYPESQTGNSGHFYIDRDGRIEEWVPVNHIAHHVRDFNAKSIGIELVNSGRYQDWFQSDNQYMSEDYPEAQIEALASLVNQLVTQLPGLEMIAGHEDLDSVVQPSEDNQDIMIRRKIDPGPLFPWSEFLDRVLLSRCTLVNHEN